MSRSYKHTPFCDSTNNLRKFWKKQFNHKLRRLNLTDDYPHCSYKKVGDQWLLRDFKEVGITFEEYYRRRVRAWHTAHTHSSVPYPDREECYKEYVKYFLRK